MKSVQLGAAVFAGLLLLGVAQTPASAASKITEAFLANVADNATFLDQSSRIAVSRARSADMRDYARSQALEATKVASLMGDVSPADLSAVAVAQNDDVTTGRSVAVAGATDAPSLVHQAANGRMPPGTDDIARLRTLSGRAFDDLYWEKQLEALSQIEGDYRAYIAHGDDPVLIALARAELPKIMHRLEALTKI